MPTFDATASTFLTAAATVLAGSIFAVVGYFYRRHEERKKCFRRALFLMLEIRHSIVMQMRDTDTEVESLMQNVESVAAKQFGLPAEQMWEGGHVGHKGEMTEFLKGQGEQVKQDFGVEPAMVVELDKELKAVSEIDPVLAYYLRGHHRLEKLPVMLGGLSNLIPRGSETDNDPGTQAAKRALARLFMDIKQAAVKELDHDILTLSSGCNWWMGRKCRRILAKSRKNMVVNSEDHAELEKFMGKFHGYLEQEVKKMILKSAAPVTPSLAK